MFRLVLCALAAAEKKDVLLFLLLWAAQTGSTKPSQSASKPASQPASQLFLCLSKAVNVTTDFSGSSFLSCLLFSQSGRFVGYTLRFRKASLSEMKFANQAYRSVCLSHSQTVSQSVKQSVSQWQSQFVIQSVSELINQFSNLVNQLVRHFE